jgi:hypothetical protein
MRQFEIGKRALFCGVLYGGLALISAPVFAAGKTLRLEGDTNSRIEVENAIINGDETTLFFWTWPYPGDPDSGKPCPMNFYSVTLQAGLPSIQPEVVAKGVCAGMALLEGGLLDNGDGKIIVRDRLERWRAGRQISSEPFSSIGHIGTLRVNSDDRGSQFYGFNPSGDLVMAISVAGRAAKDWPGASWVIASLNPGNEKRWLLKAGDDVETLGIERLWAGRDGGALLHATTFRKGSMPPEPETQIRIVSADGRLSTIKLMEMAEPFDFASISPGSEEDLRKYYEHQENARPESIEKLSARPRDRGGFDVLFHRKSSVATRTGHFLYSIAPDGSLQSETALGGYIEEHGLEDWFDFYLAGGQLVLLSRAAVTQHNVNSRRKKWMQSIVSRIDLETGTPVSRLIPLDERYLEAAMNSGDEGRQYLEGQPGGEPMMLTSVGGVPLSVGRGYLRGRNTLRLNEATVDLLVFTEAYDDRQAKVAKEKNRQQRRAERESRKEQMNADLAASAGMSPEEYAALSNKEQNEVLIRQGDPNAMMAAVMKQAESARQAMAASGATPEQMAQMEAAMAQAQQMMQGGGAGMPENTQSPKSEAVLTVDSLMRGHIQYRNAGGKAATMSVINRQTGDELLKKEYADGEIDEYVSFGRYKLPLEQIGVLIKNMNGETLEDLTPALSPAM